MRVGLAPLLAGVAIAGAAPCWAAAPGVVRQVLSNGVRVQVSEQHAVPAVIASVMIDAGARRDPEGKEGLANLVADLLTEGTAARTAEQISETMDFIGARFGSGAEMDFAAITLTVLRKDLDLGMDVLVDSLLRPSFPAKEIDRRRESILAGIKAEEDEPGKVAAKAFNRALFGTGPYGHPVAGWPDSVRRLDREAVLDFYRTWYRPGRTIITVVGDVEAAAVVAGLERRVRDWSGGAGEPFVSPALAPIAARTVVIDKPTSQANIVLGHRGVARSDPDFYPLTVMNYILGGGAFSSRLFSSIRTQAGLAYSVGSFFTATKDPGSFQVVMQTKNPSAPEAIQKARQEIDRMRAQPVSEQELKEAKQYLTGSFPLRFDSNAEIAGLLGQVAFLDLGDDYFDAYVRKIDAVTAADVQRVAETYLRPEELIQVVVGKSAETGIPAPKE